MLIGAIVFAWQITTAGSAPAPSRLIIEDKHFRELEVQASEYSPTFRTLVDRLQESSVVVYVSVGTCEGSVRACLTYLTAAGGRTYVRATINPFAAGSPAILAGLFAHELRHALEVADAGVASNAQFSAFYEQHGRRSSIGYETDEAAAIGRCVEREYARLESKRCRRSACSASDDGHSATSR